MPPRLRFPRQPAEAALPHAELREREIFDKVGERCVREADAGLRFDLQREPLHGAQVASGIGEAEVAEERPGYAEVQIVRARNVRDGSLQQPTGALGEGVADIGLRAVDAHADVRGLRERDVERTQVARQIPQVALDDLPAHAEIIREQLDRVVRPAVREDAEDVVEAERRGIGRVEIARQAVGYLATPRLAPLDPNPFARQRAQFGIALA